MFQDGIEYPDQLAACCDDGLLAFERILLPDREGFIHLTELGIVLEHGKHDLKQDLPQPFSSALADGGPASMLAGTVFFQFQSGQLLDLLR